MLLRHQSALSIFFGPRTTSLTFSPLLISMFTPSLRPVTTLRRSYVLSLPLPVTTYTKVLVSSNTMALSGTVSTCLASASTISALAL